MNAFSFPAGWVAPALRAARYAKALRNWQWFCAEHPEWTLSECEEAYSWDDLPDYTIE